MHCIPNVVCPLGRFPLLKPGLRPLLLFSTSISFPVCVVHLYLTGTIPSFLAELSVSILPFSRPLLRS